MQKYETGAVRSSRMPRYDLIPRTGLERIAERFTGGLLNHPIMEGVGEPTGGALKYGECNWENGLPTSDVINHIYDHLVYYTNEFREALKSFQGDMSQVKNFMQDVSKVDDHLAGAAWGLIVLMYQENDEMFHDNSFEAPKPRIYPESVPSIEQGGSEAPGESMPEVEYLRMKLKDIEKNYVKLYEDYEGLRMKVNKYESKNKSNTSKKRRR